MGERWRVAVAVLALAAVGQAIVQSVVQTVPPGGSSAGTPLDPALLVFVTACALCALALLSTVPLLLSRPVTAAVLSAGSTVAALGLFSAPTVAGSLATLLAAWRVGATGELRLPAARRGRPAGLTGLAGPTAPDQAAQERAAQYPAAPYPAAQYLAAGLGLPFLALALARPGDVTCVLLAAVVPAAAGAGIALRAGRAARTYTEAGEALASTLVAHTARGERARIARELHDVVAHHISMIAVQAETGRLATPGLPEAGARRFGEIGDTARAGLTEMRRLLGVLRADAADAADAAQGTGAGGTGVGGTGVGGTAGGGTAGASRQPQPGLSQLAELVDAAREASPASTRLIISGPVAALDPGVELAAYRIVQEALTNARRHAPGAAVDVELRYGDSALRLRVRDNGAGPAGNPAGTAGPATGPGADPGTVLPRPSDGGHGLPGMRERALSVGGALSTGAAPGGGFLVEAVLPAEPDPLRRPREAVTAQR